MTEIVRVQTRIVVREGAKALHTQADTDRGAALAGAWCKTHAVRPELVGRWPLARVYPLMDGLVFGRCGR